MLNFFYPGANRRIAALEALVNTQSDHIAILIGRIEQLEARAESHESDLANFEAELDERIEREVEREVDNQLDGLEITVSRR